MQQTPHIILTYLHRECVLELDWKQAQTCPEQIQRWIQPTLQPTENERWAWREVAHTWDNAPFSSAKNLSKHTFHLFTRLEF